MGFAVALGAETQFQFRSRAVDTHPLYLQQTRPNFVTMSDLCPVYAPFFGAMVSLLDRSGSFGRETLIHPFYVAIRLQGCTSAIVFTCTSFALSYIFLPRF